MISERFTRPLPAGSWATGAQALSIRPDEVSTVRPEPVEGLVPGLRSTARPEPVEGLAPCLRSTARPEPVEGLAPCLRSTVRPEPVEGLVPCLRKVSTSSTRTGFKTSLGRIYSPMSVRPIDRPYHGCLNQAAVHRRARLEAAESNRFVWGPPLLHHPSASLSAR